uniref:Receptor expression-enhancing protein n=1 Tax=Scophthalmus maximus TaxID=52904 RepID=A0A8D3E1C8_SCOMX
MMYWIVFALFTTAETATDLLLSWFPFYFELKIAFVIWLLSPYTKGSSVLYRKFVHPTLSNKEKEIDEYITQAKDRSYDTMMRFGKRGLNLAATAAVTAATKGQGVLSDKLRSFSMQDLTLINADDDLALWPPGGGRGCDFSCALVCPFELMPPSCCLLDKSWFSFVQPCSPLFGSRVPC